MRKRSFFRYAIVLFLFTVLVAICVWKMVSITSLKIDADNLVAGLEEAGLSDFRVRWYDREVHINDPLFDDDQLRELSPEIEAFSGLGYLDLARSSISDAGLLSIDFERFDDLRLVRVDDTKVSEKGLAKARLHHPGTVFTATVPSFER
ncbi:hypothetical protein U8335_13635 [Roseiconus lacunae]|uniref:hypothetical protein n=1 Tax=Roseiconus lacunae TaxID=2605694 RepID=UPI0030932766|nr:hypothetical protein U8335_13635 [Stieleria sp. HD01]